jgi:simple sugar transport system permease protein
MPPHPSDKKKHENIVTPNVNIKSYLRRIGPFMGLIVIFLAGVALNGRTFLSLYNQINVLGRVSIIALPAVGMTMVILTAGIDLSVGSMVSLSSVICAMLLMERSWTKAASLTVPVFALFSLFVGYTIINRIIRRFRMHPKSASIVGFLSGICVGAIVFLICQKQVPSGFGTLAVLLIVPVFGIFLGMLNGLIIAKGKIQPFIVTLGMMSAAVGLAKFVAGKGGQIHPIYYEAAGYSAEGTSHVASQSFDLLSGKISLFGMDIFPVAGLFFLAAVFIVHFILTGLRMGRHIYAIGGNEETAWLSGINVDRVKTIVYGISGGLSALAGVLYCASYTQGKPDAGATWELDAIAAVVIGGTSLMGGRGSVIGTMVGVLILGYLGNILNLQEVPSEVQDILKGVIIIGAVLLQEGTVVRWMRSIMKKRR